MKDYLFKRIFLIVLDSVGIGALPDAAQFGDEGTNTLKHIAQAMGGISLPHLEQLGLGHIVDAEGIRKVEKPKAAFGKMAEASVGKDTMTGHWELMGLKVEKPFRTFTETGFPEELIQALEEKTGRKVIGNKAASGTEIIKELGEEHMKTGAIIVYTSADSVLQIAAHEEIVPLDELYQICEIARELTLDEPYMLGRVIARPFIGEPGAFTRTANRRDYALEPFGSTVLNTLADAGLSTIGLGKIYDIFAGSGITHSVKTKDNQDGMDKLIESMKQDFTGLCFLNLVDFDALYGHRRDPLGYGKALEEFDGRLEEVLSLLQRDDLLIITADHGNDPTHVGTDHTREYVPLLCYSPKLVEGMPLGVRSTFSDVGATIAHNFQVELPQHGASFLKEIKVREGEGPFD